MIARYRFQQGAKVEEESSGGFIIAELGPGDLAGVFEDDGETGYLYLYEENGRGIISHLHIYNRSSELDVGEDDVAVVWSTTGSKCGVIIGDGMRGIIDLESHQQMTTDFVSPDSPAISDPLWLSDFEGWTDQPGGQKDS